ncbi:MAG: PQQ-dependent sugar dehydrogenase [Actinomycetota bacterium]|nr:PQQ-dependent sugar dehydrogenase [Actinomycetota bacterium]
MFGVRKGRVKRGAASMAIMVLATAAPAGALPRGLKVANYKTGLNFPVDMAWVKGTKKIFFTEKNSGKVRVMVGRRLKRRPCRDLRVASSGEQGALGISLHPNFRKNHWLYVYYTNASPRSNRVSRFTVRNNRCRNQKNIVSGLPASSGYHNGGQLEFIGKKLFVATGENHNPSLAQQKSSRLGKVLRFKADGSVPRGNPFSRPGNRNPVWSYGHRNPFGLARKPGTRQLFETENGPNCDDELNKIVKGRNYGWGSGYDCGTRGVGRNPKGPLFRWSSIVVPTDAWWYRGRIDRLSNRLYVGDYSSGRIHRFRLNRRGSRIRSHNVIYNGSRGILDVSEGPGHWLYFLTPGAIRRIQR